MRTGVSSADGVVFFLTTTNGVVVDVTWNTVVGDGDGVVDGVVDGKKVVVVDIGVVVGDSDVFFFTKTIPL